MTVKSEYEIFKRKAWEHKRVAEFTASDELYDQAMLNYNFALEMLMKAVLLKEGVSYPKTHDLGRLSLSRDQRGVKILLSSINSTRYIRPLWNKIYNVWNPDLRYKNLGFTPEDFNEIFEAYERVYTWIENQFL